MQVVEHVEVVLPVGVDREHEIVRGELAGTHPPAQVGEREVVRRRHALVLVEAQEPAVVVARQPRLDLGARVVGGSVVDDHELVDEVAQLVEHLCDGRLFVVGGDDGDAPAALPAVARARRGVDPRRGHRLRYQSSVRCSPAARSKRGAQPSSVRARSLLTRLAR